MHWLAILWALNKMFIWFSIVNIIIKSVIPNPNQWRKKKKKKTGKKHKEKRGAHFSSISVFSQPKEGVTAAHSPGCEWLTLPQRWWQSWRPQQRPLGQPRAKMQQSSENFSLLQSWCLSPKHIFAPLSFQYVSPLLSSGCLNKNLCYSKRQGLFSEYIVLFLYNPCTFSSPVTPTIKASRYYKWLRVIIITLLWLSTLLILFKPWRKRHLWSLTPTFTPQSSHLQPLKHTAWALLDKDNLAQALPCRLRERNICMVLHIPAQLCKIYPWSKAGESGRSQCFSISGGRTCNPQWKSNI